MARSFHGLATLRHKSMGRGLHISGCLFSSTCFKAAQVEQFAHTCDVDAEPLHRYRIGGYHPVRLGDVLKAGRYQILHKLGWGGYSTVWAARDQKFHLYFFLERCGSLMSVGNNDMLLSRFQSRNWMRKVENFKSCVP